MTAPLPPSGQRSAGQASSGAGRFTNLRHLARAGSTNTVALEAAGAGAAEGLVVVADEQTAGRGRLGRSWVTPPGASLLCSVVLRPDAALAGTAPAAAGFLATAAVALAGRQAARSCYGVECGLKWPNDLLAGGRKVAGVLAERAPDGAIVVGIGCNLSSPVPGCWPPGATSLAEVAGGRSVGRDTFLEAFLAGLEDRYGHLAQSPAEGRRRLVEEVRAASATLGAEVRVELPSGEAVLGRAVAIRDDGRLVVARRSGGELVVEAGDVVHVRHRPPDRPARGPSGRVP